jgi:hypothetical protein
MSGMVDARGKQNKSPQGPAKRVLPDFTLTGVVRIETVRRRVLEADGLNSYRLTASILGQLIEHWWNLVVEAVVFQGCELVTEVQFTAKEEDSDPVIRRIMEPSGSSFQGLDLTIEPLTDRIGNPV